MSPDRPTLTAAIRAKVIELAANLGYDAQDLGDDDLIPATGYLDSAGILELVVWYEDHFDLSLTQDEINIDNLGSVNAMASFLMGRKGWG
jgi:acyl carrier protein